MSETPCLTEGAFVFSASFLGFFLLFFLGCLPAPSGWPGSDAGRQRQTAKTRTPPHPRFTTLTDCCSASTAPVSPVSINYTVKYLLKQTTHICTSSKPRFSLIASPGVGSGRRAPVPRAHGAPREPRVSAAAASPRTRPSATGPGRPRPPRKRAPHKP